MDIKISASIDNNYWYTATPTICILSVAAGNTTWSTSLNIYHLAVQKLCVHPSWIIKMKKQSDRGG